MTQNSPHKNSTSRQASKYIIPIIIVVIVAVVIAIIIKAKPDDIPSVSTSPVNKASDDIGLDVADEEINQVTDTNKPTAIQSNTAFKTGLENLPASLKDTDVDGEIIIDEQHHLVVTEGLRRLFDYFLTTQGEEDIDTIIMRVERYIRHHTPEPAASEAVSIFRNYLSYLDGITALDSSYSNFQTQATQDGKVDLNLIAQRKQDLARLRKQYFDEPTIAAFFGAEDEYDEYSLAMLNIDFDESLDEQQKEIVRQEYISRMPDNTTKTNLQNQENLQTLIERTETLKANGASKEELYRVRRELFGAPAAAKLALIDAEDEDFDQRFKQYQAQKQQLLQQGLDTQQSSAQVTQLEQQLFNDNERKRLAGYAALMEEEQQNKLESQ